MRKIQVIALSMLVCMAICQEEKKKVECPVVGIDLGTTYSCVGVFKNGHVEIIPNELGNRITPSVVAFTDEELLVGESAKIQASSNPTRTIYDVKRLIGRKYSERTVQDDKKYLPYEIVNKDTMPYIKVDQKQHAPEEISSMVLTKMKDIAQNYLGQNIKNAVVTVPAYFNDAQRQATKDAGTIAGLNVVRILNEPTAAAIAYGLDKKGEQNILVFDLGGGTFDVSILTIDNGVFEVIGTHGDTHLGGEDFDQRTMDHFIKLIQRKDKVDISKDKRAMAKLKREVEKAKRALSSVMEIEVEIEALYDGKDFKETLTRAKFEQLNEDLFKKTMGPVHKAIEDSGLTKEQIHEIVLVGGSTRIPKVRQLVKDYFKGKEPSTGINPDEAIAYGAAIQGGVICGEQQQTELVIIDATPLTLGIELEGGIMSKVIPKGSVIPTKKTKIFTTASDYQTTVVFPVYEGERPLCKDNHKLDQFELTQIPPAPQGEPQLEVTFEIDANGILAVSAKDLGTGKSQKIVISNSKGRLSQEQIDQMIRDAELNQEKDKKFKEKFNAQQNLKSYIDNIKRVINDEKTAQQIQSGDLEIVNKAIQEATNWLENDETQTKADIENKYNELEDTLKPIMSKFYQNTRGGNRFEEETEEVHDEL